MNISRIPPAEFPERSIEDHFIDWESETFGLGYGTGELPILQALTTFLANCGNGPTKRSYDYRELETQVGTSATWLLITMLVRADIIEYGTSPRFGWLTSIGETLRAFVLAHTPEQLAEMVCNAVDQAHCTPNFCNCGPLGYTPEKRCHNPFWNEKLGS